MNFILKNKKYLFLDNIYNICMYFSIYIYIYIYIYSVGMHDDEGEGTLPKLKPMEISLSIGNGVGWWNISALCS
jgi:hypothetical protein